jgi:hypothetical protein
MGKGQCYDDMVLLLLWPLITVLTPACCGSPPQDFTCLSWTRALALQV